MRANVDALRPVSADGLGELTVEQIVVIGLGVVMVLMVLLLLAIFLLWSQYRYRREAILPADISDELLDQVPVPPDGYAPFWVSPVPPGHVPPGAYPGQPERPR